MIIPFHISLFNQVATNQISHSNRVMQLVKQTERDTLPLDKDEAWVEVKGATHNLKHF